MIAIQAHSFSTRLPGKIYREIKGKSLLEWCVESCREITNQVVVVGTLGDRDLAEYCAHHNIAHHAAAVDDQDVLGRYASLLRTYRPPWVCRVTSDCPYISVPQLAYAVATHLKGFDFTSNIFPPRHTPDGDDVEVMSARLLEHLDQRVNQMEYREHVCSWVYDHTETLSKDFRICKITQMLDFSHVKTSIDTEEDLKRVEAML